MRRGAGGIGTSAERARRVSRALGSNRFPFENHRRIRVACVGRRDHARLGDRDWARTATTDTSSISGATSASGHRRCSSPVDRGFSNGSSMVRHSHSPLRRCGCSALRGRAKALRFRPSVEPTSAPRRGCSPAARGGLSLALRIQPLTPRPCRYRPPRHREGGCVRTRQPATGPARLRRADQ